MARADIPNYGPVNVAGFTTEETITPAGTDLVPVIDVSDNNKLKASTVTDIGTGGSGLPTIGSSTDNAIAKWNGTGGTAVQNSNVTVDDNGTVNIPSGQSYKINGTALASTDITNSVAGPASSTDNGITRYDGTGGKTVQNTSVTIDDNNIIDGAAQILQKQQTITYAATITPNANSGTDIAVGQLTGDITINAMTNQQAGSSGWFIFTVDGTDRTITWNANYKMTGGEKTWTAPASTEIIVSWKSDGTNVTFTNTAWGIS